MSVLLLADGEGEGGIPLPVLIIVLLIVAAVICSGTRGDGS